MLRRADDCCHLRLARDLAGGARRANKTANARFEVANRLHADARLAHTDGEEVRAEAFVEPRELEPEQQAVYRAAVRGYLRVFGDRPGRAADLGWTTPMPDLEVELVANVGLALELADGTHELRLLRVGGRRTGAPLLDAVELRCVLVRTASWCDDQLRIVAADLLEDEIAECEPEVAADRAEAMEWLQDRVEVIKRAAGHGAPRIGKECNGCPFVARCPLHN
jgi:hypothetical protein